MSDSPENGLQIDVKELTELNTQFGLEMRPMSDKEHSQILGVAKSRNKVRMAMSGKEPILLKTYKDTRNAFERPQAERAQREKEVIGFLHEQNCDFSPSLASNEIATDKHGDSVVALKYKNGFTPLSAIQPLISKELSNPNDQTGFLAGAFRKARNLHDIGVYHGDLHLENVGLVPPGTRAEGPSYLIVDYETSQLKSETSDRRQFYLATEDITTLAAHSLFVATNGEAYGNIPGTTKEIMQNLINDNYYQGQEAPAQYLANAIELRYVEIANRFGNR